MDQKSEIESPAAEIRDKRVASTGRKSMTRRRFIRGAGLLALGIGANRIASKFKGLIEDSPEKQNDVVSEAGVDLSVENSLLKRESERGEKSAFGLVFGDLNSKEREGARQLVDKMKDEALYPHSSFDEMLAVTNTYQPQIREAAEKFGTPADLALGIVFIENGGGADQTSEAGARGPAQLMPETARRYGLIVNDQIDERTDPNKCFRAMCNYLSDMKTLFGGNLGIAVWGYHAGDGNVYGALRAYFQDTEGLDLGDIITDSQEEAERIAQNYREKVKQAKLNIHQLFSNNAARQEILVNRGLGDETEFYVYKAVGGAEIFAEAQ